MSMSTITPTQAPSSPAAFPMAAVLYRMTVDEYERIGELLDDPRVELIDGHLVKKMPKNPEHSWTITPPATTSSRASRSRW